MRFPRILSLYATKEVVLYALLGLFGFGAILLGPNLLRHITDVANEGLTTREVLAILGALASMILSQAIPVGFLFGVLVAVGRLSSDSELTAMRALGVSLGQFFVPFVVLGLLVSALTGYLLHEVEPAARLKLREIGSEIAARGAIIQPGHFQPLDKRKERVLFFESKTDDGELRGVLISDRTKEDNPFTVLAEAGRFEFDGASARGTLELSRGDIHFEPRSITDDDYRTIHFEDFRYAFDASALPLGSGPCIILPREMKTGRIREILAHFRSYGEPPDCARVRTREIYELEYHQRFASPAAPILFALVGVPLGMRRSRGARSYGFLVCVLLAFGYYMLMSFSTLLADEGALPASIALWLPNLVLGVIAALLLARARRAEV